MVKRGSQAGWPTMAREPSVEHMTSIWAHRGTSSEAPENTLPAFELAISQGADGFELDVQRTADGELLVCHDETIDRMSGASGAVVGLTLDEIRSHNFGGSFGLDGVKAPTLREVFDLMRGNDVVCNVELKDSLEPYPGMAAQVLDLIRECGLAERIWISSFNHWTLRRALRRTAGRPLGLRDPAGRPGDPPVLAVAGPRPGDHRALPGDGHRRARMDLQYHR